MNDDDIRRDRYGRPLIIPLDGGKPTGYTRVSTLAKTLDDTTALTLWKQRMTAVGIASNPHLSARVAGVINNYDDPISDGKRDLNSIIAEAIEAAGSTRAASTGTALHELTQAADAGRELKVIPEGMAAHLHEYEVATARLEVVDIETFVVIDELHAAGSLDRLMRLPDGRVVVADLKTGQYEPQYPLAVATQIAMYARGERYDPATGERSLLHPDLDVTTGLLIHLPAKSSPVTCRLYELDLTVGWDVARLAQQVRVARQFKPIREMAS